MLNGNFIMALLHYKSEGNEKNSFEVDSSGNLWKNVHLKHPVSLGVVLECCDEV